MSGAMPEYNRYEPASELPGTLRRSCREAQETFIRARDRAVEIYVEGDQAYRAAFAVVPRRWQRVLEAPAA